MNEPQDDLQKRLILAFALTFVVILGWPYLMTNLGFVQTPPTAIKSESLESGQTRPQMDKNQVLSGQDTPKEFKRLEITGNSESKSTLFGFTGTSASIGQISIKPPSYKVDSGELDLLTPESGWGLLSLSWDNTLVPWEGWTGFSGQSPQGIQARWDYDFSKDGQRNAAHAALTLTNSSSSAQTVQPRILAGRSLHDPKDHERYRLLRAEVSGKARDLHVKKGVMVQRFDGAVGWVTGQTKYYTVIVEPAEKPAALLVSEDPRHLPQAWVEYAPIELAANETRVLHFRLYAGPLDYRYLDALKMDTAVSLGAFTVIVRLLQAAMNSFHSWFGSYGFAIVILTVLLSLLTYPLTWTSFRTMKKMEMVQPEIKALQEKYKTDPKRMNEELMKVYKKHQVNPLSGCLPLLLQMPIFMGLYQVLSRSAELRGARFLLIQDLAAPDAILKLPMVVPMLGSAINILPIAMAGMMYVQQRMSMRSKTGALTDEQRIQQQVFAFMPLLFGFMFYALPSGLVLYWLLNTTLVVMQQKFMLRKIA